MVQCRQTLLRTYGVMGNSSFEITSQTTLSTTTCWQTVPSTHIGKHLSHGVHSFSLGRYPEYAAAQSVDGTGWLLDG